MDVWLSAPEGWLPSAGTVALKLRNYGSICSGIFTFYLRVALCFHVTYTYTSDRVATDENGFYHIAATPGGYRLVAHSEPDVSGLSYFHARVEVKAGEITIADDILVDFCPDMKLLAPEDGAILTTARPAFAWESYSGAVVYEVLVYGDGGTFYRFGETEKNTIIADEELPPDTYEWYITAYADEWKLDRLGDSQKWHFTVSESQ